MFNQSNEVVVFNQIKQNFSLNVLGYFDESKIPSSLTLMGIYPHGISTSLKYPHLSPRWDQIKKKLNSRNVIFYKYKVKF